MMSFSAFDKTVIITSDAQKKIKNTKLLAKGFAEVKGMEQRDQAYYCCTIGEGRTQLPHYRQFLFLKKGNLPQSCA